MLFVATLSALRKFYGRLADDERGNVLMLMGFAIVPLMLSGGIAVDYSRAAQLQTKLNATADAAALAAVSQPMMKQSNATAEQTARNMFNAQASNLPNLVYDPSTLVVTIVGTVGAANTRMATVTYTAQSKNAFGGLIGIMLTTIGGTSQSHADAAPNIDFYMLMDSSPSMLLPATTTGLATLTSATGGCAFACHQTNTNPSNSGELVCTTTTTGSGKNKVTTTNCKDYYQVARDNNLTLRTDLVTEAVQNLTDVATSTASDNGARYRMGLYDFDYVYRQLWPANTIPGYNVDSNLSTVKSHVVDMQPLVYCQNNARICGSSDNDTGTNFTAAFNGALASMPLSPGNGTNVAGDTPQAILFIITDGMRDEAFGGRTMGPLPTSFCDSVKARGIRIAILHTEYLPESASDSWSQSNVKLPYLSPTDKISPALIACASPSLYYQVTTDSDVSAALASLFQKAVSTAHIVQ